MSSPIVTPDDLGTYLNDSGINIDRASALIADAQSLCEDVVSPLPASAAVVVKRVAGRAYTSITSPRAAQAAAAGSPFGAVGTGSGGVYLTKWDVKDLRRAAGTSAAFSIDQLPSTYATPSDLPYWDQYSIPQSQP